MRAIDASILRVKAAHLRGWHAEKKEKKRVITSFLPLVIVVVLLGAVSLVLLARSGTKTPLFDFVGKSLSSGFSFMETSRLREAAKVAGIKDLGLLFHSTRDLDKVIAAISGVDGTRSREVTRLLEKLFELRKRLEFEQPRYLMGIRSSRHLAQGQRLRVLLGGLGVFDSTLIDNNPRYMVLSWPIGIKLPKGFVWKGKKISVYFWRRDDAGYVFDSYVLDDLRIRDIPVIHVAHSESLLRTQKRKSVRTRTTIPAYLYLLKRIEGAFEKPELEPGLRSRLADLSEDGFALTIGGRARVGLLVKAQFSLGARQIVMSGTVRSVDFDRSTNMSTMHVEAVAPSSRTRNALRAYVYGNNAQKGDSRIEAEG